MLNCLNINKMAKRHCSAVEGCYCC